MKKLKLLLSLVLLVLIPALSYSQNKTITGKVTDSKDNAPLADATVSASGKSASTKTGPDGSYSLTVPESVKRLNISYVGYAEQTVSITGETVNVSMVSSAQSLTDVVVIGYGTARRKDLTGSVASVSSREFNKGVQPAPDQLIQGKVAGVQVVNNSGAPGTGTSFRIRGASSIRAGNTPLFVVDGVPLSNTNSRPDISFTGDISGGAPSGNPLNFINPADISSMEVLKDASAAAIYGSRGANGVVLITTKRGSGGTRIDVNGAFGFSKILKKLAVLNGDEYRKALGEYGFPTTVNTAALPTANFGSNVDALGAVLQTAITHNYGVSLSSGNENVKQRLSFSYLDQEGIIRKTGFTKMTAGLTSNYKLLSNKKLSLDINVLTSHTIEKVAPISNSAGFRGSLIGQALQWNPTKALRKSNDSLNIEYGSDNINPLAYSEAYFDKPKVTTVLVSVAPSYKITNHIEVKSQLSVNYSQGLRKQYTTAYINLNDLAINKTTGKGGEANVSSNELITKQITNTISYVNDINSKISLNAVLGHEYLKTDFNGNSNYARGLIATDKPYYLFMASSDPSTRRTFGFADPTQELQSFFARAIVTLSDRYTFTGTVRNDGSSKFGENKKYGIFPSIAAGWNINKENFMSGISKINLLKLRASYGITGNQEFPAGAAQRLYTLTSSNPATLQQTQIANPDLKWESTSTLNLGLDFAIASNRITGTVEWFKRNTKDIIFPREAADPVTPNGAIKWTNIPGNIINTGVELTINANVVKQRDFNWNLGFNVAFLKNKLTNFGQLQLPTGEVNGQGLSNAYAQLLVNDQPLNSFYLKKFIGIDKATGVSLYENGEDKFFLGSPNPKMLLGITTSVSYKKISLDISMNGAFGHYIYNNTANATTSFNNLGKRNVGVSELATAQSIGEQPVNPTSSSSRYLEKGNYIRLANATLSYMIGNLGSSIKGLNLFVTGQNLFIITKYTGFDPEVNTSKPLNNVPSFGMEYTPYPTSRTITIGVNMSL